MKTAAKEKTRQRDEELTPQALLERGERMIADGHRTVFAAILAAKDYYNQRTSPFSRTKYLALVSDGKLPARKHGKDVLVLRSDLHAYIEKEGLARGHRTDDEDVDDILDTVVRGARK